MFLLVGFHLDPDVARLGEFLTCLERNVTNPTIDEVHVFVEEAIDAVELAGRHPQLQSRKVRLVLTGVRVTYEALFAYANRELPGRLVIVANADIFFDHTLARLDDYDLDGCLLCLSRWDVHADGMWSLFDYEHSQYVWIFQTPIREFSCDFPLGILGCDNRVAWEADRAGPIAVNPSVCPRLPLACERHPQRHGRAAAGRTCGSCHAGSDREVGTCLTKDSPPGLFENRAVTRTS